MHKNSYEIMARYRVEHFHESGKTVVDIGAQDINGSYRPLFPDCIYIGIDAAAGNGVDRLMVSEFNTGMDPDFVDLVISGQCLEHCTNPFRLVAEMYRICKPGGKCLIIAPFIFKEHRYPVDCWRFLPDGMDCLFADAGFKKIESKIIGNDCVGFAEK